MSQENFDFGSAAQIYFDAGWKPIPGKKSNNTPAVNRHSGRNNLRVANQSQLDAWKNQFRGSSVNLRMWDVENEDGFETIGIDVDHYNEKKGYDYFKELEQRLGPLPATWRSSSRGAMDENPSGIRFYKIPSGLNCWDFKGKNIDIIWKGNRYATAWPAVSGKTGRLYRWYDEGDSLAPVGTVPTVWELPELPEAWVNEITKQREKFFSANEDILVNIEEIDEWIETTLFDFYGEMCDCTKRVFDKRMSVFADTLEHHEPQKDTIWQLCQMALEHHRGCGTAIDAYIEAWIEDAGNKEKRDLGEAQRELKNSYQGAMRKLFGRELKDKECGLSNDVIPVFQNLLGLGLGNDSTGLGVGLLPAPDYEPNDDGNGIHLYHTFNTIDGATIRYVTDMDKNGIWITWDKENNRWMIDENGNRIRNCWRRVKQRQNLYLDALVAQYIAAKTVAAAQPPMNSHANYNQAKAELDKWSRHITNSGNNRQAIEAIRNAGTHVSVSTKELDTNKNLLGVANGVLKLDKDRARLDKAAMSDLITMNTNVPLLAFEEVNSRGEQLWNEFLDLALPNPKYRKMAQMAAGYCLFGGNPGRHIIFCVGGTTTGKSTFINALEKAYGDYAAPVSKTLFQSKQFPVALWVNQKKRLLVNSEFDTLTRVSSAIFKELAGNTDSQSAEIKREMRTDIVRPEFTLMVATNKMPAFHDVDLATKKRFYIIPFNQTLPDKGEFAIELMEFGGEAILQWAVEGYNMYRQNGELYKDEETMGFIDHAMGEIDAYTAFIEEELERHPEYSDNKIHWREWREHRPEWCLSATLVYERYRHWFTQNGYQEKDRIEKNGLTRRLQGWGLIITPNRTSINGNPDRYWTGIRFAERSNVVKFRSSGNS